MVLAIVLDRGVKHQLVGVQDSDDGCEDLCRVGFDETNMRTQSQVLGDAARRAAIGNDEYAGCHRLESVCDGAVFFTRARGSDEHEADLVVVQEAAHGGAIADCDRVRTWLGQCRTDRAPSSGIGLKRRKTKIQFHQGCRSLN